MEKEITIFFLCSWVGFFIPFFFPFTFFIIVKLYLCKKIVLITTLNTYIFYQFFCYIVAFVLKVNIIIGAF